METKQKEKDFSESLYYQLKLTDKYFAMLSRQLEMKLDLPVSLDEMCVLDTIYKNNGMLHQRDLAKKILKDRGNTGRLLDTLENDGYIIRKEITKNKRQARVISITDNGCDVVQECKEIIYPILSKIEEKFTQDKIDKVIECLIHFRKVIEETIEIHI